jgi:vitamin B12 transporter
MPVPRSTGPIGSAVPVFAAVAIATFLCSGAAAQQMPSPQVPSLQAAPQQIPSQQAPSLQTSPSQQTSSEQAPSQQAPSPNMTLGPVVVTATRLPTPESEVASSVTVITAAEIQQKQERTLPDVLADVPGLNVVQTGGPGGTTSVYMRGTNANEVKVLIDGIDVSDPSSPDGSFNFANILTSDIARVEVLRGPQSGLYGAGAIGGVINIITKTGAGPPTLNGTIETGSFGTFNQYANAGGSTGRFNYDFNIGHFSSDDTPVTPPGLVATGRPVNTDSYDNVTLSTRLGANLTDNFDLGLVARYIDAFYHFTEDDFLGPEALPTDGLSQDLYTRAIAHLSLFDGRFDETLGLAYTGYHNRYLDPNAATIAEGNDPSDYDGGRTKLDWQGNIKLVPGQILTLGAEHEYYWLADSAPAAAHDTNDAGYIQLQSSWGERLFDTVSLRYDDNGQFGGKATYRFAPAYLIPETGTKLKATVGTGYNPPSLDELYDNYPQFDFYANPNLKPETSLGYDAGFEQALLNQRVGFGATWFHNNINNLITINDTGTSYENIGKATTYGVESFVAVQPWQPLKLRGDYTFTIAEDDILHEELLRRPKNKASLDATWLVTAAASLTATLLYVGPWIDTNRDATESGIPANGYMLVNLDASYDLGHGVTAFARIDNLLNRHYQDPLGFDHPGLGVYAGLRVAFAPVAFGSGAGRESQE